MIRSIKYTPDNSLKRFKTLALLLCVLLLTCILSLFTGVQPLPIKSIWSFDSAAVEILLISRIPRTVTIILTGAGLSVCGVILQQLTQNKFISPTTAGTLDAAKLGILFSLLLFPTAGLLTKLTMGAVLCFLLTAAFTFSITRIVKRNTVLIPIFGVMYGYILNAIANVIGVSFNILQNMENWMVGNFTKTLKGQYEIIYILLPLFVICYLYARQFTIVSMGRDFTANLGLSYPLVVNTGLILTSVTVSTTILIAGSIPFIDVVIPNIVSILHGDNAEKNLPYTACYGAITLVACDTLGRVIITPYEIPGSMIVGSLGALVFLILLIKKSK